MDKLNKVGLTLVLCVVMALTPAVLVGAETLPTTATSTESTTPKTTTARSTTTTTAATTAKTEATTAVGKASTVRITETTQTNRQTKPNTISKDTVRTRGNKKASTAKTGKHETTKRGISPKIYKDTRIEMKDHKSFVNGFVYFNQGDAAWNHNGLCIASSGCGPTSMAVCISSLTDRWVTPIDTALWAYQHGYYSSGGALHSMIPALAQAYQLKCNGLGTNATWIRDAFKDGHPVVALMGPGHFTSGGHFIVLVGINDKDEVTVADVASRVRTQNKYALGDIIKESKSASAGGPFWEVYNPVAKQAEKAKAKIRKIETERELQQKREFLVRYHDMNQVLRRNYSLLVPLKAGRVVKEEQFVTVSSLDINDTVTVVDSKTSVQKVVSLAEVVKEVKKEAIHADFSQTVTIAPNLTYMTE